MKAASNLTRNGMVLLSLCVLFGMLVRPALAGTKDQMQDNEPHLVTNMRASSRMIDLAGGLQVDPAWITARVELGHSITVPITLTNESSTGISWSVQENIPWLSEVPTSGILPGLEPAGGSIPYDTEGLLFSNGPLVTHPGGGDSGADASAMQRAIGMTTYGFIHALGLGYRIADDFTVPGNGWNISTITFFAYQTDSGTVSTIDHVNLRIWDGVPGGAGSNIVFGDSTTNRLAMTTWSNTYRVVDNALLITNRPVMADTVDVGITLPPGQYWLDWQTGGTQSSGPWAPPITLLDETTTGDALQYDPFGSVWSAAMDGGTGAIQGFPFVIEGFPVAASQVVDVTFDAGAVTQPGAYMATLVFKNDGDTGDVTVPVTMTVDAPADWGELQGSVTGLGYCDANPIILAGAEVLFTTSTGISYTLATDSGGAFKYWLPASEGPVDITVTASEHTSGIATGVEIIAGGTATEDFDLRWLEPCIGTIPTSYEVEVEEGDSLSRTLTLYNAGAALTTFQIEESGSAVLPWLSEAPITGTISADGTAEVDITFDSMTYTLGTRLAAALKVTGDDPFKPIFQIPVTMTIAAPALGVNIGADQAQTGAPGETVSYTLAVTNTGSVTDTYEITARAGWDVQMSATEMVLGDGERVEFVIQVTIPANADNGDRDFATIKVMSLNVSQSMDECTLITSAEFRKIFLPQVMYK